MLVQKIQFTIRFFLIAITFIIASCGVDGVSSKELIIGNTPPIDPEVPELPKVITVKATLMSATLSGFSLQMSFDPKVSTPLVPADFSTVNSTSVINITGHGTVTANTNVPIISINSIKFVDGSFRYNFDVRTRSLSEGATYFVDLTKLDYKADRIIFKTPATISKRASIVSLNIANTFSISDWSGSASTGFSTLLWNAPKYILPTSPATISPPVRLDFLLAPGAIARVQGQRINNGDSLLFTVDASNNISQVIEVTAEDKTTKASYTVSFKRYDPTGIATNTNYNPYGVYSPFDLFRLDGEEGIFKVMRDIIFPDMQGYDDVNDPDHVGITDYSQKGWRPVDINGYLDGNGHIIKNLQVDRGNSALFTSILTSFGKDPKESGVVKNLGVEIKKMKATTEAAGIVLTNNGTIDGVYVKGVGGGIIDAGRSAAGFVLTANASSVIRNSYTKINVTSNYSAAGFAKSNKGIIDSVYAKGDVSTVFESAGFLVSNSASGTVLKSYWSGNQTVGIKSDLATPTAGVVSRWTVPLPPISICGGAPSPTCVNWDPLIWHIPSSGYDGGFPILTDVGDGVNN